MKLHVLVPNFRIHVSVTDLYIPMIGHPILLQKIGGPIVGKSKIAHSHMNVEIGNEAAQFLVRHKSDLLSCVGSQITKYIRQSYSRVSATANR
jgi:hypothetical protein